MKHNLIESNSCRSQLTVSANNQVTFRGGSKVKGGRNPQQRMLQMNSGKSVFTLCYFAHKCDIGVQSRFIYSAKPKGNICSLEKYQQILYFGCPRLI